MKKWKLLVERGPNLWEAWRRKKLEEDRDPKKELLEQRRSPKALRESQDSNNPRQGRRLPYIDGINDNDSILG